MWWRPTAPQSATLGFGAHIAVGTPGRILKHLEQGTLRRSLRALVLDEADRMLDMGFGEDIHRVIRFAPRERQTLLFSATYPEGIANMSRGVQRQPVEVSVEALHQETAIAQQLFEGATRSTPRGAGTSAKPLPAQLLCGVLRIPRRACNEVTDYLIGRGFSALALVAIWNSATAIRVLVRFASAAAQPFWVTPMWPRGVWMSGARCRDQLQLTYDPEVHVHRIGRTGRAGQQGLALSLYRANEAQRVTVIEEYLGSTLPQGDLNSLEASLRPVLPGMPPVNRRRPQGQVTPGGYPRRLDRRRRLKRGDQVGKIQVQDQFAYVAVRRSQAKAALKRLNDGKIRAAATACVCWGKPARRGVFAG